MVCQIRITTFSAGPVQKELCQVIGIEIVLQQKFRREVCLVDHGRSSVSYELYVRFLRVAERRIVEQSGRGIICYISSYSYLKDASFVVVRQRLLESFDAIWIDCLNGDSRETGKLTPEGLPDPSVFSTELNRAGIRLGTAIGTFVRRADADDTVPEKVSFRDFWGSEKRGNLLTSLENSELENSYVSVTPSAESRYSFRQVATVGAYRSWPSLIDMCEAEPFSGVLEMRRGTLIDFEKQTLTKVIERFTDPTIDIETLRSEAAGPVFNMAR